MVGFNDLLTNVGSTATIQNYTQIIDRIHTFNPRTIVYVLSVLPTRGQRAGMNQQIKALNQEISNLADNKTIIFVDMYKSFLKGEELRARNYLLETGCI